MNPKLAAANAALAQGDRAGAVDLIIDALSDRSLPDEQLYRVLLSNLLTLRRYAEGVDWAAKALDLVPHSYEFHNYLGVFLRRTARYNEGLAILDKAIALRPDELSAYANKGNILNDMNDGEAAEAVFNLLVQRSPRNTEFQRALGRALWLQTKLDAAAVRFRQAIGLQKDNLEAWLDLSAVVIESGKAEAGLKILDKGLAAHPNSPRLLRAKAAAFRRLGRASEARELLESLRELMDGTAWYHHEFGRLLSDTDRLQANEHFRRALEIDPYDLDARMALIESLDRTREGDESSRIEEAYRLLKAMDFPAQLEPPHTKIAVEVLSRSADYEAAESFGDFQTLGRSWAAYGAHTALLGHMPRAKTAEDRRELVHQHRLWGNAIIEKTKHKPITPAAPRGSSQKIRLGFMSSDLREHPVTSFAWPLFEHADRDRFEIYCYSFYTGAQADRAQQYVASKVDAFRWNPYMNHREAAQMIADDGLDILFELGGSTHMNKLEVMAWKPAPLMASWLGYPHSSGLDTIDYLLLDPFLNPPDPALLIEKPLIMPHTWIAMGEQAFPDRHKIVPAAPVCRNGFVTFGTANNPYKYNATLLRSWAQVVARVPDSRFLFVRPEGGSEIFRSNVRAFFEAEGIAGDRVEFRAVRGLHMQHYNDIDIALDTFPQTGGTTTCEAAWMGVPTVTLVGEALFERLSYSILQNAGLGDLCAPTLEAYLDTAVALAGDADRLQALRVNLRDQLRACPLGQTRQFSQDFYDLIATTVR
ncbi:tetratricopeptide repeat protein [Sphingomonadaceae bacterium G21617-S1]|nr:tetratricopeptide repeat protein [Sphingomonadaceae bacterium G21617-S1]